jgi:hypothetical protein
MRFSRSECEQCMLAINSEKKIQEIQKRSLALDFTEAYLQEGVFFFTLCRIALMIGSSLSVRQWCVSSYIREH